MANNNNNPGNFIFIFIAVMIMFSGNGGFIFPIALGFILYKIFGGKNKQQQRNQNQRRQRRGQQRDYRRRDTDFERPTERRQERTTRRAERPKRPTSRKPKNNPYKKSGMAKYKEYDYKGAIEDFEKSLAVDDSDVATHFNIACSYSIMENKDKAFFHLSKAVEFGFSDFEKIKTHDALAYLRIQDEFEMFVQNNYKLKPGSASQGEKINQNNDLLEQLNKLAELREKGLLTEEEFVAQKRRLLE